MHDFLTFYACRFMPVADSANFVVKAFRQTPLFTETVEIDQEKSVKSVKSVVEMAYFGAESIFVRLQMRT
jgi:hypothetical protein